MQKNWIFVVLVSMMAALAISSQVMASPASDNGGWGTPGRPGFRSGSPTPTFEPGATLDPNQPTPPANPQGNPQGDPQGDPQGGEQGKPPQNPQGTPDGLADKQPGKQKEGRNGFQRGADYRGMISAITADSLTITTDDNTSVTFSLTANTRYRAPAPGHDREAAYSSLQTGMKVAVHSYKDSDGSLVAWAVLVIPGRPEITHRIGVVTAYTAGASITVKGWDGNSTTFALTAATGILPADQAASLAVGSYVTIIAPRGSSTAIAIVIIPAE